MDYEQIIQNDPSEGYDTFLKLMKANKIRDVRRSCPYPINEKSELRINVYKHPAKKNKESRITLSNQAEIDDYIKSNKRPFAGKPANSGYTWEYEVITPTEKGSKKSNVWCTFYLNYGGFSII